MPRESEQGEEALVFVVTLDSLASFAGFNAKAATKDVAMVTAGDRSGTGAQARERACGSSRPDAVACIDGEASVVLLSSTYVGGAALLARNVFGERSTVRVTTPDDAIVVARLV